MEFEYKALLELCGERRKKILSSLLPAGEPVALFRTDIWGIGVPR